AALFGALTVSTPQAAVRTQGPVRAGGEVIGRSNHWSGQALIPAAAEGGVTATAPLTFTNYPLDPNNFLSLGASPFTSGTYTIDASANNAGPTLSGPGIATPIQGVFFSPSGDPSLRDEIAVFTFNSISIPAGVTVQGARNANSRPIALLS